MDKKQNRSFIAWANLLLVALLLTACAKDPIKIAESYAAQDDWLRAVVEYRKAYNRNPADVELKSRLKQAELKAADFYYQRGIRLLDKNNLDAAIVQFQHGLTAMPDHAKLQQTMRVAVNRKEADILYLEGMRQRDAGKLGAAKRSFERALRHYSKHKQAAAALAKITEAERAASSERFALSSRKPITLNFRQTNIRTAFEFIAKSFGINVIFDENVRRTPVTLFAKNITFEQGLSLLIATTKTFYKRVGPNTLLIAPDTPAKRGQYEDFIIRTFHLSTVKAKDMVKIIKGVLRVRKIIVNEELNTIIVRDTTPVIKLIEKLVAINDRRAPGLIIDVEILEVNRTKAEKLGFDFGSYEIIGAVPTYPLGGSFKTARALGTMTIPSLTFRFFKSDVDAKTLANPKIRVLNRKSAKIHIGDRVPLRSSSITETTGQVRTTFNYTDIGIKLEVEPTIHLDNSVTIKLGLEVSTLGENLGTANDPAFRIGTRNVNTYMLLRDGETAILGGLIRDEERRNRVKVPGFGSIPIIGALFRSRDDEKIRSDVLLTITPRVVRGWDLPSDSLRSIYSGTATRYTTKPIFASLSKQARVDGRKAIAPRISVGSTRTATAKAPVALPPGTLIGGMPLFTFSRPLYQVGTGSEMVIDLIGRNLGNARNLPIQILYNPQLLEFIKGERGVASSDFRVNADKSKGLLTINMSLDKGAATNKDAILARVTLRALKPGISYLVYRIPTIKNAKGESVNAQVRASRVVVK